MAEFYSSNMIKIKAKLSNSQIVECKAFLKAYGYYNEWWSTPPSEWTYSYREFEQYIDESSIDILYPEIKFNGTILKIIEIIDILEDIHWVVQEGWEKDL